MFREIQPYPTEPATPTTPTTHARTRTLTCSQTCSPMVTLALCLCIAAAGCLASGREILEPPDVDDAADRATQIETVKASIERDHRTLEDLITQPGLAADESLHENPELRAIAERLTAQERALEQLKLTPVSDAESSAPSE